MTKFKKFLFCFMGLAIFAALPLAHAQDTAEPEGPSAKWHGVQRTQEIYSQLQLTDAQKQALEANKQQHRARMKSARQEMRADKEAMQAQLMKPQLDMARINEIHRKINTLQSQMEDNRLSSILAVRTILTPEQFSRFITLMHQHRQERSK